VLSRLFGGADLDADLARAALGSILSGAADPLQAAALVGALRVKGETADELRGFVAAMREHGEEVDLGPARSQAIDTCGTGGDRAGTINVSTIAALVAAGAGVPVLKHGGRASSSRVGSADVLEALGAVVDLGPAGVRACLEASGFGFCWAPRFHLAVPTVFNFLGPLVNPGRVLRQVVGVGDPAMAERMLDVLEANGAVHAIVCYGHDGLDELSTVAPSTVHETRVDASGQRRRRVFTLDPGALGFRPARREELQGGDASENAARLRAVLAGERGAQRDFSVLNAAAALVVGDAAGDLAEAVELAEKALDSGRALEVLERFIAASRAAAEARG
jgi:anthranilate phosphoribosyltransferase